MPGVDSYSLDNYGLDGPVGGVNAKSGITNLSTADTVLNITGLGFSPDKVLITISIQSQGTRLAIISSSNDLYLGNSSGVLLNGLAYNQSGGGLSLSLGNRVINVDGFSFDGLPTGVTKTVNWFAYGKIE